MAYPKLKLDPVKEALLEFSGNTSAVAHKFGVTRQAVQQFINKNEGLKESAIEAKETMKDNVESALYRAALAGEAWAVCFYLKTQAKDRGYVERSEVTGADGGAIEHRHGVFQEAAKLIYGDEHSKELN